MDYGKLTAKHTRLRSISARHPNKRGEEIARFGKPDTQERLTTFLELLSMHYLVHVIDGDDLALALVRSFVVFQTHHSSSTRWSLPLENFRNAIGLRRHQFDRAKQQLMESNELTHDVEGFIRTSYFRYQSKASLEPLCEFTFYPALAKPLGYKAAAFFGWLAAMDRDLEAQGYFFHRPLGEIQAALGLSRFQLDQARKTLIDHHLMQERYWGIPAVREFRIKLDGLPALLDQIDSQELSNGSR